MDKVLYHKLVLFYFVYLINYLQHLKVVDNVIKILLYKLNFKKINSCDSISLKPSHFTIAPDLHFG